MNLLIITSERLHPNNTFASIFELSNADLLKESVSNLGILSVFELNSLNIINAILKKLSNSSNEISQRFNFADLLKFLFRSIFYSNTVVNQFKIGKIDITEAVGITSLFSFLKSFNNHKSWVGHGLCAYEHFTKFKFVPNVIHAHSRFLKAGLISLEIKKRSGIPYVITEHSSHIINDNIPIKLKQLLLSVYSNSSCLISVSNYLKFNIISKLQYNGEIRVIPNVLDKIYQSKIKDKYSSVNEFVFINVASLLPIKNQRLLLDSFALLKNDKFSVKDIKLVIVGAGPLMGELKEYSNKNNIGDDISFVGGCDKFDVLDHLGNSNAFILTSISETFGVVVMEALACGLPVITTKSGGPEELVNYSNGIIVDHNKYNIYEAMKFVVLNYNSYDSDEIRSNCLHNFSSQKVLIELLNVYENVLNSDIKL